MIFKSLFRALYVICHCDLIYVPKVNCCNFYIHQHIWHILHYTVQDQWSGFSPSALTRPRKAPARSIHSSTEEQHCGFSQTVTHPSTNVANCCLTSIVVTLAFVDRSFTFGIFPCLLIFLVFTVSNIQTTFPVPPVSRPGLATLLILVWSTTLCIKSPARTCVEFW